MYLKHKHWTGYNSALQSDTIYLLMTNSTGWSTLARSASENSGGLISSLETSWTVITQPEDKKLDPFDSENLD